MSMPCALIRAVIRRRWMRPGWWVTRGVLLGTLALLVVLVEARDGASRTVDVATCAVALPWLASALTPVAAEYSVRNQDPGR